MRSWLFACLLVACERTGDSQDPASKPAPAPTGPQSIDATIAVVDAGVDAPTPDDKEALALAQKLTAIKPSHDGDDMSKRSTGSVQSGGKPATTVGRIFVTSKLALDDSALKPEVVIGKIKSAYMAGMKRCYTDQLQKDPAARGRLTLTFAVDDTGRTIKPKATGLTPVDACVANRMSSWRFAVPRDKDGAPTTARFEIALELVPE